jgi:pimeloyl-ACP methyl ester carboxylesterase
MDIILIPGLWLDGASWNKVIPVLGEAGHRTHPVTLPGMEHKDAYRSRITLRDHVDAVIEVIDAASPARGKLVLVGHSGGGAIAHAAVDARPDRVARVVYVDSWPLGEGGIINDELPVENGEIPLPDWSYFDDEDLIDLDDELRAWFRARAIPSPARVPSDRQRLSDERRYDVPVTVIACEVPAVTLRTWVANDEPPLRELARISNVTYVDLPTGHWPQFTRPRDLGRVIAACIALRRLDLFFLGLVLVQDAQRSRAHRAAEQLTDQCPVRGVQGPDRGAGEPGFDRRLAAPGPAGLGGDPQVPGVAAFQVGGDDGARVEPPAQHVRGLRAERARVRAQVGTGVGVQVNVAHVEAREFGYGASGGRDQGGYRRCPQCCRGVGVHRSAD